MTLLCQSLSLLSHCRRVCLSSPPTFLPFVPETQRHAQRRPIALEKCGNHLLQDSQRNRAFRIKVRMDPSGRIYPPFSEFWWLTLFCFYYWPLEAIVLEKYCLDLKLSECDINYRGFPPSVSLPAVFSVQEPLGASREVQMKQEGAVLRKACPRLTLGFCLQTRLFHFLLLTILRSWPCSCFTDKETETRENVSLCSGTHGA